MLVQVTTKPEESPRGQITYIVDRGLLTYLKVAAGVLAIIIGVGAFVFGFDVTKGRKEVAALADSMKEFFQKQQEEFEKRQKDLEQKVAAAGKHAETLANIERDSEQLRARAEIASKNAENNERAMDARFKQLIQERPSGISEERVRQIVQEILSASLPKLRSAGDAREVATLVDEAVKGLANSQENQQALTKIKGDAAYAVEFLNQRFGLKRELPPIVLLDPSYRNAYWDGEKYRSPPQVVHLPDVTYHELAYPFISDKVKFEYYGQAGALLQSFADVFTALIKQKRAGIPEDEYWLIAPGAGAWLAGQDIKETKPRVPLRSMKAPGMAFRNHPVLGNDPQPAHFRDLYTGKEDNGGVHINSGIPNKAFYETAIAIGLDKAGEIWYQTLSKLQPQSNFYQVALAAIEVAGMQYGQNSQEQTAVKKAWEIVGVTEAQRNYGPPVDPSTFEKGVPAGEKKTAWVYLGTFAQGKWLKPNFNPEKVPEPGDRIRALRDVPARDSVITRIKGDEWRLGRAVVVVRQGSEVRVLTVQQVDNDEGVGYWWASIVIEAT
jgi:hypothetical protein